MQSIFVDLTGFVNPCSLHRVESPSGRAGAITSRSIANNAARCIATRAESCAVEAAANSRLLRLRDTQAGIRRDVFTPRIQHSFAQKQIELRHHRITRSA